MSQKKPSAKAAVKKPRQIVHIATIITSTFGYVDEGGNVIPLPQINAQLPSLEKKFFDEAFAKLADEREKLKDS